MKINEIWDPSMYRAGDESDPRSPYYEEPPSRVGSGTLTIENAIATLLINGDEYDAEYSAVFKYSTSDTIDPAVARQYRGSDENPPFESEVVSLDHVTVRSVTIEAFEGQNRMSGEEFAEKFGADALLHDMSNITEAFLFEIENDNSVDRVSDEFDASEVKVEFA